MKRDGSTGRTICTRSSAVASASTEQETTPALSLRRSTRGTQSTSAKIITPTSSTRRSGRLASSPASVTKSSGKSSGKMEKKPAASPLGRSCKGKTVSSENRKGSLDKSGRNANTPSSVIVETKGKAIDNVQESTDELKNKEPKMTGRSYRALYRGHIKKEPNATLNDDELVVVGCSRRVPAGNDDVRDDNSSPHVNTDSKGLPVGETSLEKAPDFPVKVTKDTENMVLDSSPMVGSSRRKPAGNDDARGVNSSPHANSESKGLPVGETSLEKAPDIPVKVMKDTENMVLDSSPMVGSSRRKPAGNDDARGVNSSPHANTESKGLPVGETSLEKASDFPVKVTKDTENMVLDSSSPLVKTGDVTGPPSGNPETQKLGDSTTSLETDIDLPLKRKRDTAEIVVDACANADDRIMSSDAVIPSPSGCTNNNQPERCGTCQKRQKVNDDFDNLSVCSCIAPPVQESDYVTQDMKEPGPATSRDYGGNRQNMQQDKSYDPKLLSMYPEYWVPVQLSDVQMELYCRTLFSKSLSLSSLSKNDLVGALEETLTSVRKTCDHPYVMDASLKQLLTKNLQLHEILDVEVKASGKLHLLDAMLTQIKAKGLKAVVFYQATKSPEGLLLANILEDFLSQRFGQNSYEHGVCLSKKTAINNFNKETQCFILLLETRACSQSIKLLRAEAFILFGSSLNPSHDVKLLEKIKIESYSERTKIFRLYSVCTVEEKALILARQNKPLENLNRPLTHALLMWGASYLFDKLDHFHGNGTPDSGVSSEQPIKDAVIHEFSSILSSNVGEETEGNLSLLLEAKHAQGIYITDATLIGEEHVKLSDEISPNVFWAKLLGGKNPMWKYCTDTPQRSRKRVRHLQSSEESAKVDNGGNIKKKKKASDDVTVDNDGRKASGKDQIGDLESPKVTRLKSSRGSASGTNDSLDGNDATGLYSMGGHISGIPEDMLAGIDWRLTPRESQRSLFAVLKPDMAKLCLSEDSTSTAEKFLEYIIENHRVCKEPVTTLQAFQIALSWIAATLVQQKCNREESLVRAKSELGFSCSREEVDYMYSFLYCMKSLFLGRTQGVQLNCLGTKKVNESLSGDTVRQEKNNTKSMRSSDGEECLTEKRGSHYSSVTKDVEKTISDITRKCSKKLLKLVQTHEEKKVDLMKSNADKKQEIQTWKKVAESYIRVTCSGLSTQTLLDNLQGVEDDFERKNDDLKRETDECLKRLEQMHESAKKKLADDEAFWISRIENWAQAELINCAPIQSGNNKHLSALCSSRTIKNAPDVQFCNDASGETTYADTNCMVAKENQAPEAENSLRTMSGGSGQQVHEMVASRNDKAMDVSTLSPEQPTDNVATKSRPNEHASLTAPEILIPAGCQEEFAALNVQLPEYQICDRVTSATPDEDVPSRVPEVYQSFANLAKSASLESSLNREEALVLIENDRLSHAVSDADNILDYQNEKSCSLDKEIPDELALPMSHPVHVVNTGGSTVSDQDDHEICPMPSSPGGKQPDPAANIQGKSIEATIEPAESPMPSSPGGKQTDPAGNIQGKSIKAAIEPAESLMPSSPGGKQPGPAENTQGKSIEAAIEPEPAESPMPSSPGGKQPGPAENTQGKSIEAAIEPEPAESPMPSSPGGKQPGLAANTQGKRIEAAIEPEPAESPMPSSPAGQQPDPAENIQGKNIEATIESQPAVQGDQVACPLPSSPAGNQSDSGANMESQNISTSAEPHISDQETMGVWDACSLPTPLIGAQADLAANNITTVARDGSSPPGNQFDAAVSTEGVNNNTTMAVPHTTDACELEVAEPDAQVEQSTFANNVALRVHEGVVEHSAGVTAPVPSHLNNVTGQTAIQPVPQIPFPVFNDPFQHELEKLRRESENTKKIYEEKKSVLKAELDRKMAELQAEYQRKFHEVEAEHTAKATKIETGKNLVVMNKLLASAFLSKCTSRMASHRSTAPRGRIQQLAQRAAQMSALRNYYTASAPALQPQASSVSRSAGLPPNSMHCPVPQPRQPLIANTPQPRQPLISNTAPPLSASPALHRNHPYRPPSSSIPIPTTIPASSAVPQGLVYSSVLIQQQEQQHQQQHNLGSGLKRSNDVVCLSDDE